jgi:rRNA maturation endonuclease Nob1
MCIKTRSTPRNKLPRVVRWKNVRVAYCVKCQHSYPWETEHCAQCGAKLVPKIERVEVEER